MQNKKQKENRIKQKQPKPNQTPQRTKGNKHYNNKYHHKPQTKQNGN